MKIKKLYRSTQDKVISGVAGGIAEYFGVSSKVFRIFFLIGSIFPTFGAGIVIYCILWILIPKSPANIKEKKKSKPGEVIIDVDVVKK